MLISQLPVEVVITCYCFLDMKNCMMEAKPFKLLKAISAEKKCLSLQDSFVYTLCVYRCTFCEALMGKFDLTTFPEGPVTHREWVIFTTMPHV